MRYFLLPGAKATLAQGIIQAPVTGGAIAGTGPLQCGPARLLRTAVGAIDMAPDAAATQDDLAMTTGAVEKPRAGVHRHPLPMSTGKTGCWVPH